MIGKAIVEIAEILGAPSVDEMPKVHCRDCGVEIDRRNMFCVSDRVRRYKELGLVKDED